MTKYLIFGNGYIGSVLGSYLKESKVSKIRINNEEEVLAEIISYDPEIVINCAGKTGRPNID
jgi:dTDP-4-dehydrorhamnose reductase